MSKEYMREWEEKNRERRRKYKRDWYRKNKEKSKKYYEENKENIKEYREKNKENRKEYDRQYTKIKIRCEICDKMITKKNKNRHQRSMKHIRNKEAK